MEINFNSSNMGELIIKEVPKSIAKELIIKNHYSHKWNTGFGKINFGIFKKDNEECLGVAVFGNLMHPKSFKNINSEINQDEIIELNRMWIDDVLGHNAESILISKSFKIMKAKYPYIKIVQTFADGRLGCGTIYKATNFRYYGYKSTLFIEDIDSKEIHHDVVIHNARRYNKMIHLLERYALGRLRFFKVKTYRYLYILDRKYIKSVVLKEQPYPAYDKGQIPCEYKPSLNSLVKAYIIQKELNRDTTILKDYIYNSFPLTDIEKSIINAYNNEFVKMAIAKK